MSGPKSSRYRLTAEQLQRIVEEQERLRKELEEKARIERETIEAKKYLSEIKTKNRENLSLLKNYESRIEINDGAVPLLQKFTDLYSLIEQNDKVCTVKQEESLPSLLKRKTKADSFLNEINFVKGNIISETDDIITKQRIRYDSVIAEGSKLSFDKIGVVEEKENPIFNQIQNKLAKLMDMKISRKLSDEVKKAVNQAEQLKDSPTLSNFLAVTVVPLEKRCLKYQSFEQRQGEQFIQLSDTYNVLCKQLNIVPGKVEFSESGIKKLSEAVKDMKNEILQIEEQSYIRKSIDEVMSDMGYEVIGQRHVKKKSGKEFNSRLLSYEDGTVINITEASNGQITMEIGGIDNADRLPTSNERVALRKNMESFCTDFKEIEKRLSERGVVLDSRLIMSPPEEEYAQIININDYDIREDYMLSSFTKKIESTNTKRKLQNE